VLLSVLVYAGALRHGFIWDDPQVLEQLRHMHGVRDLLVPPEAVPRFYYRPLNFLTFAIDRALGGEAPFWFHATVIAWHAAATGLVYLLGCQILGERFRAESCAAALLFAIHSIHVESVAWIAGRSDVIATALVIAAVLASARVRRGWTAWVAGGLLLAGLLVKEVAVAGLILVPARDFFFERRLLWRRYLPLAAAAAAYLVLRRIGLGTLTPGLPVEQDAGRIAWSVLAAVGWYASKLLVPVNLSAYVPVVPDGAAYVAAGSAVCALIAATVLGGLRKRGGAVPAFLALWFGATLAPSLVVIVRRSASVLLADRYLYLPSVAGVLVVGWLLAHLRPVGRSAWRAAAAAVVVLAIVGAARCVDRTRVWADDLVFWTDTARSTPGEGLPHRELGSALMRRNRLDEAESEFRAALRSTDTLAGRVMANNNLGNLYLRRDQFGPAERAFEAAIRIHEDAFLYNGLARVAMKRAEAAQARGAQSEVVRRVLKARALLEKAIELDAGDYKSHALLGQVLLSLGQREAARRHLETALRIQPHGAVADTSRRFLAELGERAAGRAEP
jgi:tetratricopeptide (TPR) repeat protein